MTDSTKNRKFTIRPDYYGDFHCLCSDCTDTCCKGWIIEIDPACLENWKRFSAQKNLNRNDKGSNLPVFTDHIDKITAANGNVRYHIRLAEDKHCPFLTSDGLCSVVIALGHEATTDICRDFPRHFEEYENLLEHTLAVRCYAVLDLLWAKDSFAYEIVDGESGEKLSELNIAKIDFPAKDLLDGILEMGNAFPDDAGSFLTNLFESLYETHLKVSPLVPRDETGYKEYGQEYLNEENVRETLKSLAAKLAKGLESDSTHAPGDNSAAQDSCGSCGSCDSHDFPKACELPLHYLEEFAQAHHDFLYEMSKSFFESPIFGPDFEKCFYESKELLLHPDEDALREYGNALFMGQEEERKLKLLVLEELFTAVLSIEVQDYETILCRLQWLIVQYLVCRYVLFLEKRREGKLAAERFAYLISRVFRISDLPDILKVSFFDMEFLHWLWTPEHVRELIGR